MTTEIVRVEVRPLSGQESPQIIRWMNAQAPGMPYFHKQAYFRYRNSLTTHFIRVLPIGASNCADGIAFGDLDFLLTMIPPHALFHEETEGFIKMAEILDPEQTNVVAFLMLYDVDVDNRTITRLGFVKPEQIPAEVIYG